MATSNSAAHISVVPKTPALPVEERNLRHTRFQFVGDNSLQMKMLMSLISGKFGFPAAISAVSTLDIDDLNNRPDTLVVLDCLSVSEEDILRLQEQLDPERLPGIVLINTSRSTPVEELAEWPQVVGVFQNNTDSELVLAGFDQLLKGGMWLPRGVMEALILKGGRQQNIRRKPIPVKLTRRETQILEKLSEGTSNTRIADSLFLSEHTVKTHLYNIYKKVNVSNRTQACNWLKKYRPD